MQNFLKTENRNLKLAKKISKRAQLNKNKWMKKNSLKSIKKILTKIFNAFNLARRMESRKDQCITPRKSFAKISKKL
jgi:hypothetical protein